MRGTLGLASSIASVILTAIVTTFVTVAAWGQSAELLERNFSGTSKAETQQAAKAVILNQASQSVSEELIRELIGAERYTKNKTLIANKIIKNSARYIPFSKPSNIVAEDGEFKMSVALKVSLRDLKQMLQENSLLSENEAIPVVLPVITFVDHVQSRSYRWWQPADKNVQGFLFKEGRAMEDALRTAFQVKNFYVIKPLETGLGASVPSSFRNERIKGEDAQFFAKYFSAPVLIEGQVQLNKDSRDNKYTIDIRLTAVQVSNERAIADVSRRFTTDAGSFESSVDKKFREVLEGTSNDLAAQVFEAWQRGSLGTSVIRVTVKGTQSLPMMEAFKEQVRSQITQVKNIREREVSSDSTSYELDTSAPLEKLTKDIEALDFNGKKLSKISEGRDEVVFKIGR